MSANDPEFLLSVGSDWTLFLDRDGVINTRLIDDYVKTPAEFEFCESSSLAIADFSKRFGRIIVVTNQQGIGKGLMSAHHLALVHEKMTQGIAEAGGRIDGIFVCPHLKTDNCDCRKPRVGLGTQAKAAFPEIDFAKSLMVGDSVHDIEFGRALGMRTVFIAYPGTACDFADLTVDSLRSLARALYGNAESGTERPAIDARDL